MLVLTRKIGEEIIIDGNIRIMITEMGNGRVKLGIVAPKDVHIIRSELEASSKPTAAPAPCPDADLQRILETRGQNLERYIRTMKDRDSQGSRIPS